MASLVAQSTFFEPRPGGLGRGVGRTCSMTPPLGPITGGPIGRRGTARSVPRSCSDAHSFGRTRQVSCLARKTCDHIRELIWSRRMPKRSRISLDDLIAAAERGAAGLKIGKGRKVTDPTTEALTAECEALRLQVKLANEQAEHYKAEAIRLSDLLQDAQAERDELRLTN